MGSGLCLLTASFMMPSISTAPTHWPSLNLGSDAPQIPLRSRYTSHRIQCSVVCDTQDWTRNAHTEPTRIYMIPSSGSKLCFASRRGNFAILQRLCRESFSLEPSIQIKSPQTTFRNTQILRVVQCPLPEMDGTESLDGAAHENLFRSARLVLWSQFVSRESPELPLL